MDVATTLAIVTIAIVIVFDYTNGFHDASNIVATVVASRALTVRANACSCSSNSSAGASAT